MGTTIRTLRSSTELMDVQPFATTEGARYLD
jgi:hypothetical protein